MADSAFPGLLINHAHDHCPLKSTIAGNFSIPHPGYKGGTDACSSHFVVVDKNCCFRFSLYFWGFLRLGGGWERWLHLPFAALCVTANACAFGNRSVGSTCLLPHCV